VREVTDATWEAEVLHAAGPVLVEFGAPWCKPCDAIEPILEALSAEHGVPLVRLDIDANLATPSRYDVLSLPTVMVFDGGAPRATVVGAKARKHYERELGPWLKP
jgi:thioredoxin 1